MFKKNIFGQRIFVKKFIIRFFGLLIYGRFNLRYKTDIKGAEKFRDLPESNVLIISNHQTYFADVSFFFHVIYASLLGSPNKVRRPGFLWPKKHNIYYIAAEETMRSGIIPKLLALSGAITIQRTWRSNGENVRRKGNKQDAKNIDMALKDGWVITFPQGTTSPYAKGRVGTAIIAKNNKPIVVPVVIDGFRRAFDKKGLKMRKKGSVLKMRVKDPLYIDYDQPVEQILEQMMDAIEQSKKFDSFPEKTKESTSE
ncbi:1-acyl-sn-glycerol-3-phosphate acyltransferase [Paracrocinitomix mangrovi]|uniref:lysophospholipid acyltransferase family protein n=1 Tax=Paracrocinitomix mangrovi TaxID=2862509 RepID=UPI001C8CF61E|nr:lysophospholipid acyltransferase family protein [Paracrocinitomix mangrovi]UKN03197.1 1-acyl-sn-glycerol-3-phosphate acyltransferase [Paracrocinitomix mangrovi]